MTPAVCLTLVLALSAGPVAAATCTTTSGTQRVTVLELYTSEGCSSCPPADRWVSTLPALELGADRVVTLAYHVDYWDDLGWHDPFAQARFSERQRFANARIRKRTIYTPQVMLDGQDYRQWQWRNDIEARIDTVNQEQPGADIALSLSGDAAALDVSVRVALRREDAAAGVFVALYENRLMNRVSAGENIGKRLAHDFVVRELAGPFAVGVAATSHRFRLAETWKKRDLSVAAFVQSAATGEVLQALAVPWCD